MSLRTLRGKSRVERLTLLASAIALASGQAEARSGDEATRLLAEVDQKAKVREQFPENEKLYRRLQYLDRQMTMAALGGAGLRKAASEAITESGLLPPSSMTLDRKASMSKFLGEGTRWSDVQRVLDDPDGYEYFISSDSDGRIGVGSAVALVATEVAESPNGLAMVRIVVAKVAQAKLAVGDVFLAFADEDWLKDTYGTASSAAERPISLLADFAHTYGADFKIGSDDTLYRFLPHRTVITRPEAVAESGSDDVQFPIVTVNMAGKGEEPGSGRLGIAAFNMTPVDADAPQGDQHLSMFGVLSLNEAKYHESIRRYGIAVTPRTGRG